MTKTIDTQILINATPEKVWQKLTDFENYELWNPFIIKISGSLEVGKTLYVKMKTKENSSMTFRPKVLRCEEDRNLVWKGKVLIPGLFDGKHTFELIDNKNGTTLFVQNEVFSGILVSLFDLNSTRRSFEHMNECLKSLCEAVE